MHGDLLAERGQLFLVAGGFEPDQDADLAEARRCCAVHVACHDAVPDLDRGVAAEVHVLADGGDQAGDILLGGLPLDLASLEGIQSALDGQP